MKIFRQSLNRYTMVTCLLTLGMFSCKKEPNVSQDENFKPELSSQLQTNNGKMAYFLDDNFKNNIIVQSQFSDAENNRILREAYQEWANIDNGSTQLNFAIVDNQFAKENVDPFNAENRTIIIMDDKLNYASAAMPYGSYSRVGRRITINEGLLNQMRPAQKKRALISLIGVTLGLSNQFASADSKFIVPGTPVVDTESVMFPGYPNPSSSCSVCNEPDFTKFSDNDIVAARYLFPKLSRNNVAVSTVPNVLGKYPANNLHGGTELTINWPKDTYPPNYKMIIRLEDPMTMYKSYHIPKVEDKSRTVKVNVQDGSYTFKDIDIDFMYFHLYGMDPTTGGGNGNSYASGIIQRN